MRLIDHAKLVTENGMIWNGRVLWDGDTILEAGPAEDVTIPEGAEIVDVKGRYVSAGLIDIHIHGGGEYRFYQNPLYCIRWVLPKGTTTVLATTGENQSREEHLRSAKEIKALQKEKLGHVIRGIYMEGPYMSGIGGHMSQCKWKGDVRKEDYQPLIEGVKDEALVWAIDPRRPGIEDFIRDVKAAIPGIIFAYGHSKGTAAECRKLQKYGFRVQTHHMDSGQSAGNAQGLPGAGVDQYAYLTPDLFIELICDQLGIHVCPDQIKSAIRIKGTEKVILITDAGHIEYNKNDEASGIKYAPDLNYDDRGWLTGSRMILADACRNLMTHTKYGICEAISMATINPARMLGIDDRYGSLEKGKISNIIVFDDMIRVEKVFLEGELVAENGELLPAFR